jgi:hypothetical protein
MIELILLVGNYLGRSCLFNALRLEREPFAPRFPEKPGLLIRLLLVSRCC